jgi:hypothetical protein
MTTDSTDLRVLDIIDRALRDRPFCSCGRHATAVWRDGAVWLECSFVIEPADSPWRRLRATLSKPMHLHAPLIEVPARSVAITRGREALANPR